MSPDRLHLSDSPPTSSILGDQPKAGALLGDETALQVLFLSDGDETKTGMPREEFPFGIAPLFPGDEPKAGALLGDETPLFLSDCDATTPLFCSDGDETKTGMPREDEESPFGIAPLFPGDPTAPLFLSDGEETKTGIPREDEDAPFGIAPLFPGDAAEGSGGGARIAEERAPCRKCRRELLAAAETREVREGRLERLPASWESECSSLGAALWK